MNTPAGHLPETTPTPTSRLIGRDLVVGYGAEPVIDGLSIDIPAGTFTAIVGPNACGKSTLLRTLARMLAPRSGQVLLDGDPISRRSPKEVARTLAVLPQAPIAPDAIAVDDLVARGRFAHQGIFGQWSQADTDAVDAAMRRARVQDLAGRLVNDLSGGQRQRVWLAMVLAQQSPLMLLDEPTTYLDITHQVEVLDLCAELSEDGLTVVAVLHDLNLAFRYASNVIVMARGTILAQGAPGDVITAELIEAAYGLQCRVIVDPEAGTPMVVPRQRSPRSHPPPSTAK